MDLVILFLRLAITLTFLILAAGGPWAIILLRRFIRRYGIAHEALEARVQANERRLQTIERQLNITPPGDQKDA